MDTVDRRKFSRIAVGEESCTLTVNGVPYSVELVDQSIDGLRVEGISLLVFTSNVPMTLQHEGMSTEVVCRNVSRISNKEFALGLRRIDGNTKKKPDYVPQIFINPYVRINGLRVLCSPLNMQGSNLLVELPGKREFQVDLNLIDTRLRHERVKELELAGILTDLAAFYSAASGVSVAPSVDSIVEFEFGREHSETESLQSSR